MVEKVIFSGITLKKTQSILRRVNKCLNGKGSDYTFTLYRTAESEEFVLSFENNIKVNEFLVFCHVFFKYAATKVSKIHGWFEVNDHSVVGLPVNSLLMVAPARHSKRVSTTDDMTIISDDGKSYMNTTLEYNRHDPIFFKNPEAKQVYEKERYVSSVEYTAYPYPILYKIGQGLCFFHVTPLKHGFFYSVAHRGSSRSLPVEREKIK